MLEVVLGEVLEEVLVGVLEALDTLTISRQSSFRIQVM